MNSSTKLSVIVLSSAIALSACSDKSNEVEVPLSEVPANIITIVQNTLPGISLSEAEKETKDDTVIYELEGKLINGKEYEIEIAADGTIIKIELED
ncbi:MAG: hypothetical protein KJN89_06145 [Gammaproteobacteria bacterium]|nr:hypothetical protein [Gammaproteobacteria bacterium]MBT8133042.1 hypothetical protein [Gammaproteobacteria bacterium]NNJ49937.1 hypothetical protein [Gammaproteobacteria bacterium]